MGVTGLKRYIKNSNLFQDSQIERGQKVLIDGPSLLRHLCDEPAILYGGEYQTIYETMKEFFHKMVKDAGISLVIIMDGAWADEKFQDIINSHEVNLKRIEDLVNNNRSYYKPLPAFAMKCFTDAIEAFKEEHEDGKLKVEIITAQFEADPELAREAVGGFCSIISNDTDMIIFNIPKGLVDLSTLAWKDIENGALYVKCQRVMSADVAKALDIEVKNLPLFATLRKYYQAYKQGPQTNDNRSVYPWISKFIKKNGGDDQTVLKAVGIGSDEDLEKMKKHIDSYIIGNMKADQTDIPERIRDLIDTGRLYHGALVVWKQGMFIPKKQIEDFSKPNSNDVSRDLRCMWYSIICAGERDSVIEYSRLPGSTKSFEDTLKLNKHMKLQDGNHIDLRRVDELDALTKRKLLLDTFEWENGETDLTLWSDGSMELPTLVTNYWNKKTNPGERIADALKKYLQRRCTVKEGFHGSDASFNLDMAHAYAQWQSCLMAAYDLNVILGYPIPDFKINDLLGNGSLLHRQYSISELQMLDQ